MKVTPAALPEVLIVEPTVHGDERGFFMESWNQRAFDDAVGREVRFVQDNHSRSHRGVLRGLHYQLPPQAQGKLVRVATGAVFDVAVDIRRASPSFGRWVGVELSERNHRALWLPAGFAHGFLVLSQSADFLYKTTAYYDAALERSLRWDDPRLAIEWPAVVGGPALSNRDRSAPLLGQAELPD